MKLFKMSLTNFLAMLVISLVAQASDLDHNRPANITQTGLLQISCGE